MLNIHIFNYDFFFVHSNVAFVKNYVEVIWTQCFLKHPPHIRLLYGHFFRNHAMKRLSENLDLNWKSSVSTGPNTTDRTSGDSLLWII